MSAHKLARLLGVVITLYLSTGCSLELEMFLSNNTDTAITLGAEHTNQKLTIASHAIVKVNDFWPMNPIVIRHGKVYHYIYPITPLPSEYTDGGGIKLSRRFEFANDNRIYILRKGESSDCIPLIQPTGFPLKPQ